MSRIEELIKELCPDGMEYVQLKNVCSDFIVPMRDRPKLFDGTIPWCRIEDIEGQYFNTSLSGHFVSEKIIKEMNLKVNPIGTVICSCSASLGTYAINTQPLITNQTFIGIVCGEKLFNKFLLYFMETQTKKLTAVSNSGTIPYISRKKFEDLVIPLPPLPVQHEIVRILDNFAELTAQLTTELTARKKQYEYYRNNLLMFEDSVEHKQLSEILTLARGMRVVRSQLDTEGKYPVYQNSMTPLGYYSKKNCRANMTFVIAAGAAGEIGYSNVGFWAADDCYYFDCPENILLDRFLYFVLLSQKARISKMVRKASIPRLARSSVERLIIPVPSIEEQQRVVTILNRFDALCNDLTSGLPAEIEARHKQYEYYRDKLLTFKELGA